MIGYSSRALNTDALQALQIQNAHGFAVGQIVRHNGAQWVLAQADSIANSSGICMVSIVVDPNSFYITQTGLVNNIVQVLPTGVQLYLSPTVAGELTSTRPTTIGQCIVACAKAITANEAYFYTGPQELITPSSDVQTIVVNANTNMAVNTIYIIDGAVPLDMTLPVNFSTSDRIGIRGANGNGWIIKQNANQSILAGGLTSTVGVGGEVQSTANWNCIDLEVIDDDLQMEATNIEGVINVI
jgi:hypothetical protein